MKNTLIEKIISSHADEPVRPGQIVDVAIDVRAARDFGGANVVKNLQQNELTVADATRTLFTFDCNPGGSDQGYAANQHFCRSYARAHGIGLRDITQGIGTHIAIEEGLIGPGATFVSTDSHANIMGAVGAFGQGMGDKDIAATWATGKIWFKVPPTVRLRLRGRPGPQATAKDIVLAMARQLGANGLLGCAAEIEGPVVEDLDLASRITIASMATEMGGIIALFAPSDEIIAFCRSAGGKDFASITADADAEYQQDIVVDIDGLEPLIARPGHPEDVIPVREIAGRRVDSVFLGSCTNGRIEDLRAAAELLKGCQVAPGVVMKVVPATRRVWEQALNEGLIDDFTQAGVLIGNPGCAGCAAGQIGQNGPGEVTVSTGNRNYTGKQGKGEVFLASPATAAASAIAGVITSADNMSVPARTAPSAQASNFAPPTEIAQTTPRKIGADRPTIITGRAWFVNMDNIDTDMIYHNAHLAVTDPAQMGQYAFGNLEGWEDFQHKRQPGDIIVTGKNFGCGSSRQQAVDCFLSLGISVIVGASFSAIYERNAINAGLPIITADLTEAGLQNGEEITVDLNTGCITLAGNEYQGEPFSSVQMAIYRRGGLLVKE